MSQKKKVVVTTSSKKTKSTKADSSSKSTSSTRKSSSRVKEEKPLTYGRKNYILMAVGLGVILLGLLLMSGGSMPDPDVWDDSIIYSARRITLAPIVILAGLIIEIVAIFKVK